MTAYVGEKASVIGTQLGNAAGSVKESINEGTIDAAKNKMYQTKDSIVQSYNDGTLVNNTTETAKKAGGYLYSFGTGLLSKAKDSLSQQKE